MCVCYCVSPLAKSPQCVCMGGKAFIMAVGLVGVLSEYHPVSSPASVRGSKGASHVEQAAEPSLSSQCTGIRRVTSLSLWYPQIIRQSRDRRGDKEGVRGMRGTDLHLLELPRGSPVPPQVARQPRDRSAGRSPEHTAVTVDFGAMISLAFVESVFQ